MSRSRSRYGFFQSLQFHLESTNLLKEFGFAGRLRLLVTSPLLAKQLVVQFSGPIIHFHHYMFVRLR